jgi:hypothetical protein
LSAVARRAKAEAIPIILQTALMGFAKGSTLVLLADLPPWQIKSGHWDAAN